MAMKKRIDELENIIKEMANKFEDVELKLDNLETRLHELVLVKSLPTIEDTTKPSKVISLQRLRTIT